MHTARSVRRLGAAAVLAAVAGSLVALRAQQPAASALDTAMRAFWDAGSPADAEKRVARVVATGATFDQVLARLKAGRSYGTARSGHVELQTSDRGIALDNMAEVPEGYDPARRWPLRVHLHGGVGRAAPGENGPAARPLSNRVPLDGEIALHPRAWAQSEWWTWGQVENVLGLVDRLKRRYNVDESRVVITGISDGGTGVYFLGMRAATPWAACMPLNGHPSVLANPDVGADGQLYPGNLANCATYIVNGGRDRLYPAASVAPLVDMLKQAGVPLVFQVYPEAGHDVSWWPQEKARYGAFATSHPRVAHPDRVSWETERTDRYNRFRWVVIDRLGRRATDVNTLTDVNTFAPVPGRDITLYDRDKPSGRVDVERRGNSFEARTRGVASFTLLLSPEVVDFSKPVTVTVNGRSVHDGLVKPDLTTLLTWAARDNDRTMLYGAQLTLTVH
jgi:poly(3-hydroxybutyrate) depolymerase